MIEDFDSFKLSVDRLMHKHENFHTGIIRVVINFHNVLCDRDILRGVRVEPEVKIGAVQFVERFLKKLPNDIFKMEMDMARKWGFEFALSGFFADATLMKTKISVQSDVFPRKYLRILG